MTTQEAINTAKYEAEDVRFELLAICDMLRENGAIGEASSLEEIVSKIDEWQNN